MFGINVKKEVQIILKINLAMLILILLHCILTHTWNKLVRNF